MHILISLIAEEAGINVEGVQKFLNQKMMHEAGINVEGGIFWEKLVHTYIPAINEKLSVEKI